MHGALHISRPDMPRQVAKILRSDPVPGATAWVVNSEPVIYFLSGIPIPTRFPFPPSLVGSYSGYNGSQPEIEVHRILAARPRYLIVGSNWNLIESALRPIIRSGIDSEYRLLR